MDRLSIAFFAAAFLIAGSAVTGLALRAGVGTRVADASVAASFGGVATGGSTSIPASATTASSKTEVAAVSGTRPIPGEPAVEAKIAVVASAPKKPTPAPRTAVSDREVAVPAPAGDAAPEPCPVVFAAVPGFEWTEEHQAALARTIAKAEQSAARMHVRRVRLEQVRTRIRTVERDDAKCPKDEAGDHEFTFEVVSPTPS